MYRSRLAEGRQQNKSAENNNSPPERPTKYLISPQEHQYPLQSPEAPQLIVQAFRAFQKLYLQDPEIHHFQSKKDGAKWLQKYSNPGSTRATTGRMG